MARRKRKAQVVKDTIFVICGNTKTEKNYFDHVKGRLNNALGQMKIKTDASIQSCWIIWSNIFFEIWLLCHFKFFTKEMKEKALEKELDKIIGNDLNLKNKYTKWNIL